MEEQENLATINVVKNAIDDASADRLRILLKYVYALEREPEACARIKSLLLFDERNHFFGPAGDEPKTESKDEWNDNPVSKGSIDDDLPDNLKAMLQHLAANDALAVIGRYRVDQLRGKRKRFAICSRCREDYDVKANSWNSCHWHDGVSASAGSRAQAFESPANIACGAGQLQTHKTTRTETWDEGRLMMVQVTDTYRDHDQSTWSCCGQLEDITGCCSGYHVDRQSTAARDETN